MMEDFHPDWIEPGSTMEGVFSGLTSTAQFLQPLPFGKAKVLPFLAGVTGLTAYGKYRDMGLGKGASLLGGTAEGAIEAVTEFYPTRFLLGGLGGGVAKRAAHYLLSEFGGEQAATAGQMAVETALGPKTWGEYWEELPGAAYQTLIATATMSAAAGGGALAIHRFGRQVDRARDSTSALHGQATLDAVMKHAESVEMRKTAPEEFARFVEEGTKNSPVRHVFLPVEAVDAILADETIPDEEKAALTVYQSQIEEARVSNGDVVVPIGEAAAAFAGTKMWQSLREDARVLAGGISGREAKANMDNMVQELEKIGTDAVAEAKELQPRIQAKAAIYDTVKKQMVAAGRGIQEAQHTAVLMASRAESLASARYG
ncbi:MAG: hypothetical protein M3R04_08415, partial [bacterium]|nr:hypothetical protein [bacterium]